MTYNIKTVVPILLLLSFFSCKSQKDTTESMNSPIQLNKKQIVQKAQDIIKEDLGEYVPDFFEIRAYHLDNEIVVIFYVPIHLAQKGDYYYHSAVVEINSESKSYGPYSNSEEANPSDLWKFYKTTPEKTEISEKIVSSIASYAEVTKELLFPKDYRLEILENTDGFSAKVVTPNYMDTYELHKQDYTVKSKKSRNHKRFTLVDQGFIEIH